MRDRFVGINHPLAPWALRGPLRPAAWRAMFGLSAEELESFDDTNPLQAPDLPAGSSASSPFESQYLNFCKSLAGVDEFGRVPTAVSKLFATTTISILEPRAPWLQLIASGLFGSPLL